MRRVLIGLLGLSLCAPAFSDIAIQNEYGPSADPLSVTVSAGSDLGLVCSILAEDTGASAPFPPTGVTFNGAAMTKAISNADIAGGGDRADASIWYLANPDVTTANVDATWASAPTQNRIYCYVVTDFAQTSALANSDETAVNNTACTTTASVSLTDVAGGIAVGAYACDDGASSQSVSWTNLTEDFDPVLTGFGLAGASLLTSGTSARTVSASGGGTGDYVLVGAVFNQATASGTTFTSGPSVAAATNGYTISGTLSGTGTLTAYAVGCAPSIAAPNTTQLEAGQCGDGNAALIAANEVWTTDVGDSFALTEAGNIPRMDVYVSGSNGTDDTTVVSFTDEDRSANTGKTLTVLASVAGTSFLSNATDSTGDTTLDSAVIAGMTDTSDFAVGMLVDVSAGFADLTDLIVEAVGADSITLEIASNATTANITVTSDDYFDPDAAAGDVIEGSTAATCDAGTDSPVTWAADGDISYTATNCGTTLTTLDYCIEDVSATNALTTTPGDCFTTYDTLYLFNTAPEWTGAQDQDPVVLDINTAMSQITLANACTDDDAHTRTFTVRSGSWPTGVSMASDGDVTGTPTVEDESGTTVDVLCQDPGLLGTAFTFTHYVIDTVTAPDYTGGTIAAANTTILGSYPWLEDDLEISTTFSCHETVAENDIISQTPTATTETSAFPNFTAVVSTGECGKGRPRIKIRPDPRIRILSIFEVPTFIERAANDAVYALAA